MPRPKKFNNANALRAMMMTFWTQGYHATSMRDLELSSQLTTGSIYNAFGSKKELFCQVLAFYIEQIIEFRIKHYLTGAVAPMEGVRGFVKDSYRIPKGSGIPSSCLLVNSALELGSSNREVGKEIRKGLHKVEDALKGCLLYAQAQGDIAPETDCCLTARHLSTLIPGLLLAAKNQKDIASLDDIVEHHIALIECK